MGFLNWWSRVRTEVHTLEPESNLAFYLAHTPPEFWAPKDWSDSRRLRNRRRVFIENEMKRGKSRDLAEMAADRKFPPGPFWPRTPERDMELWRAWFTQRAIGEMLRYMGLGPNDLHLLFVDRDPDDPNVLKAENLLTGEVRDVTFFGM